MSIMCNSIVLFNREGVLTFETYVLGVGSDNRGCIESTI